jgi:hypothetical protein
MVELTKIKEKISSRSSTDKNQDSNLLNWENDGEENKRSSMSILIDWFTTEENVSNYYGGKNKFGKTTAERKEDYHHVIKELIQKENGKIKLGLFQDKEFS